MDKETKCPECGAELKSCCILYALAGRPVPDSSELQMLLYKNAYGAGLTIGEWNRARCLIIDPEFSENLCRICKTEKSIFNTGLCQNHALYALDFRK